MPSASEIRKFVPEESRHLVPAELEELLGLLGDAGPQVEVRRLCAAGPERLPIVMAAIGNPDPDAAAIAFVGGVFSDSATNARSFIVKDNSGVLIQFFTPIR